MMRVLKILFIILYLSCLCYIVFFARRRQRMHTLDRYQLLNVVPVVNKVNEYEYMNYQKDRKQVINYFTNLLGNVVIFMPLPFVLIWLTGIRQPLRLMLIAVLISVCIEVIQFALKTGVADIDDVILNTCGAFLGILIARYLPIKFLHPPFQKRV